MSKLEKIAGDEKLQTHVIFVHGLGGHWRDTWKSDGPEPWPTWLAADCECCVWSVSYPASPLQWLGHTMHLTDRGENIAALLLAKEELRGKALIFVTHSLGGLVLKQTLRSLENGLQPPQARTMLNRIGKVCFIAVPHSGSDLAQWAKKRHRLLRPTVSVDNLTRDNRSLADLNNWYRGWAKMGVDHLILYETQNLKYGFWRFKFDVVSPSSADPGLPFPTTPVDADHLSIVNIKEKGDTTYTMVVNFVRKSYSVNQEEIDILTQDNTVEDQSSTRTPRLDVEPSAVSTRSFGDQVATFLADITPESEAARVQSRRAHHLAAAAATTARLALKRNDLAGAIIATAKLQEALQIFPPQSSKAATYEKTLVELINLQIEARK